MTWCGTVLPVRAKREWADLAAELRVEGKSRVDIAHVLRQRFGLSALAALRHARGWSQEQAARDWNARWPETPRTFKHFSGWETGRHTPGLDTFDKLAQLYECNLEDLLADRPGYRHLDDEAAPTGDVRLSSVLPDEFSLPAERAAGLGVGLWELHEALRSHRVSGEVLELAERASSRLDARFTELPPVVLFQEVGHQFQHVVGWLKEPQPVTYRQQLCSLAGRLAGLRAWLYFDMAEHDAAEAWFTAGLSAAQEAEDYDLCGWLLGAQSLIPTDRQDYRSAHVLVEQALHLAGKRTGTHTTRAWLVALEARSLAGLGDSEGFAITQRRADKQIAHSHLEERRHGMDFAKGMLDITYYQGLSHLLLGQADEAGVAFQSALDGVPDTRVKARAMLLLSLAMAAAQNQQFDQAAANASQALTVSGDQPIRRVWQRASEVRHALKPASRAAEVQELDERMEVFAGALERATPESSQ